MDIPTITILYEAYDADLWPAYAPGRVTVNPLDALPLKTGLQVPTADGLLVIPYGRLVDIEATDSLWQIL